MLDHSSRILTLIGFVSLLAGGRALAEPEAGTTEGQPGGADSPAPTDQGAAAQPGLFEQAASSAGAGSSSEESPFKLSGYLRGDAFVGKVPNQDSGEMKASYGEAAIVVRTKKTPVGAGFAELRLRYGMLGENQQQSVVDVREAYADAYLGPLEVRMGKQIIVWGKADLLNPTNNISPADFRMHSPIEDDRRMGNTGVRANLRFSPVRVEGVWVPLYTPNSLPQVVLPQYVSFGDPAFKKFSDLGNSLLAGRVHLELPSFEMSVSYLHGFAPMTGLSFNSYTDITGVGTDSPSIVIRRTAYSQRVIGFDFSTAIGDLVALRAEAAYRKPDDKYSDGNFYYVPRPDLQYTVGADHTFGYAGGSVMVIFQYLGRYTFDWKESPALQYTTDMLTGTQYTDRTAVSPVRESLAHYNQILFSQTKEIQHLATLRLDWQLLHETLSLTALGMVNVSTQEWALAPKVGWRLSDNLIAYVGGEIFRGPVGTLLGLVQDTLSAGYVELRATF